MRNLTKTTIHPTTKFLRSVGVFFWVGTSQDERTKRRSGRKKNIRLHGISKSRKNLLNKYGNHINKTYYLCVGIVLIGGFIKSTKLQRGVFERETLPFLLHGIKCQSHERERLLLF